MARRLQKRTVVIVGGGLTAGLIARQLTAKGIDVLVLDAVSITAMGPKRSCRISVTSCAGIRTRDWYRTGRCRPIRYGIAATTNHCRCAGWKRSCPAKD